MAGLEEMVMRMFGYGTAWPAWEIALMWVGMLAFVAFLIWAVYALITSTTRGPGSDSGTADARSILDQRGGRGTAGVAARPVPEMAVHLAGGLCFVTGPKDAPDARERQASFEEVVLASRAGAIEQVNHSVTPAGGRPGRRSRRTSPPSPARTTSTWSSSPARVVIRPTSACTTSTSPCPSGCWFSRGHGT